MRCSRLIKAALPATVLLAGVFGVSAQSLKETQSRLDELKAQIEAAQARQTEFEAQAQAAAAEAETLSDKLVAQGRIIELTEEAVARIETRIADLRRTALGKRQTLTERRRDMVDLIASMERLARRPAVLALAQPAKVITTARSTSVMAGLVPRINDRAIKLREDLEALARIEQALNREQTALDNRLLRLASEQAKLDTLLAVRRDEMEGATAQAARESARLSTMAREAEDLESLLRDLFSRDPRPKPDRASREKAPRFAAPPPAGSDVGRFASYRGRLLFPVVSSVKSEFGDKAGAATARGITSSARAGAQVRSPYDGEIVFAGPFRSYGQLLIIDHGDGYHSLLAGLGALYGRLGDWVLAGEPVGLMQDDNERSDFYLELRHQGNPIDPAPWFQTLSASAE